MKLYIAGPMSGYPKYNCPAFFEAACQLAMVGYEVVNPARVGQREHEEYQWYIRSGMKLLLDSHAVCVLIGWAGSKGATLEVTVAEAMGMEVGPLDFWLNEADSLVGG